LLFIGDIGVVLEGLIELLDTAIATDIIMCVAIDKGLKLLTVTSLWLGSWMYSSALPLNRKIAGKFFSSTL